jgi:hypothetical protein
MSRDLRDILRDDTSAKGELSKNHRKNFEARLQNELHAKPASNTQFFRIAASFLVLVGLGTSLFYFSPDTDLSSDTAQVSTPKIESLGSISPELKKIENYYLASIQTEIVSLQETPENKELLDGYFQKLGELTQEYKILTEELNTEGLNDKTINALIGNLQARLKLMYQLKEQLNDLKTRNLSNNENIHV